MKIFITGATGVLGNAVLPLLVAAGHHVRALNRSENNVEILRRLGAEPVLANLFDVESLKAALADSAVVLHLATKIPPTSQLGRRSAAPSAWAIDAIDDWGRS